MNELLIHGSAWGTYLFCLSVVVRRIVADLFNPNEGDKLAVVVTGGLFAVTFALIALVIWLLN